MYLWTGYNWVKSGGGSTPTYDTYNTSDTLTASRTVTLGSYQVRFYKDPTSYVIINPAYLSAIYKSASDANQTSTFQAAPYYSFLKNSYVMGGTTANASISTEANPDARRVLLEYNRGAPIVNQAYLDEQGFHVHNKDSVGFEVDANGLVSIDTILAGSGVQVLWDSTTKKLSYGSGGGGASTTSDLTDVSDAAPIAGGVLRYDEDSLKYVPTATATYNLTSPANGDLLKYQDGQWVNFTPDYGTGSSDSINVTGTADKAAFEFRPSDTALLVTYGGTVFLFKQSGTGGTETPPGGGGAGTTTDIDFSTTSNNLQESPDNTWTTITPGSSFHSTIATNTSLPASTEGRIYTYISDASAGTFVFGLVAANTAPVNASDYVAGYYVSTGETKIRHKPSELDLGAYTTGQYWGVYRNTSGLIKIQKSSDGTTWTDVYDTGVTNTGQLYIGAQIYSGGGAKMVNPKIITY